LQLHHIEHLDFLAFMQDGVCAADTGIKPYQRAALIPHDADLAVPSLADADLRLKAE
jgi:hypothetical protein